MIVDGVKSKAQVDLCDLACKELQDDSRNPKPLQCTQTSVHRRGSPFQMSKLVRMGRDGAEWQTINGLTQAGDTVQPQRMCLAYLEPLHSTPVPDKELLNNFQLNKVGLKKEKLELEVTYP